MIKVNNGPIFKLKTKGARNVKWQIQGKLPYADIYFCRCKDKGNGHWAIFLPYYYFVDKKIQIIS